MVQNLDFEDEATNYGVHSIYSYPARFPPQIPRFFIEKYNPDVVCDCFGGSGTTAVEAKIHGSHAIHADIMPISIMLATVKTHEFTAIEFHQILVRMEDALNEQVKGDIDVNMAAALARGEDREYYFTVPVQQQIAHVRAYIKTIGNLHARWFLAICASQALRRCSTTGSKLEWIFDEEKEFSTDYIGAFRSTVLRARDDFLKFYDLHPTFVNNKHPTIINTQREWIHENFDLLMTSPPYGTLNVVNYPEIHKFSHALFSEIPTPTPGMFVQTTPQLNLYFSKVIPFLKPGGHAVIVVSPSKNDDWAKDTTTIMTNLGLVKVGSTLRTIKATRKYMARGITQEYVLEFEKPKQGDEAYDPAK